MGTIQFGQPAADRADVPLAFEDRDGVAEIGLEPEEEIVVAEHEIGFLDPLDQPVGQAHAPAS